MSDHNDRGRAPRDRSPIPVIDLPGNAFPFADIPELGAEALPATTLQHLLDLDADALEAAVEIAIRILDARQGDIDIEEDDPAEDNADREGIDDDREQDDADDEEDDHGEEDDAPEDDDSDEADPDSPAFPGNLWPGSEDRKRAWQAISAGGSEDDDPAEDDDPGRCDASSPIDELDPHH
jgi:hypothetical protein